MAAVASSARRELSANSTNWSRPTAGPGARSRASSANAKLQPLSTAADAAGTIPSVLPIVRTEEVASKTGTSSELPDPRLAFLQVAAPSPPPTGRALCHSPATPRGPQHRPPPRPQSSASGPLFGVPPSDLKAKGSIVAPTVSVKDDTRTDRVKVCEDEEEETALLRALEEMGSRLDQEGAILSGVVSRGSKLSDEFEISKLEARATSAELGTIDAELSSPQAVKQEGKADVVATVTPEAVGALVDNELQQARIAMGLV